MTSDKRMTIMMTRRRTLMLGERQRKDEDGVLSHGVRLCAYSMEEICVWFCLVVFWKHSPHWRTRTNTFMQFKYALAEEECASTRLLWCRTSTATTAQETTGSYIAILPLGKKATVCSANCIRMLGARCSQSRPDKWSCDDCVQTFDTEKGEKIHTEKKHTYLLSTNVYSIICLYMHVRMLPVAVCCSVLRCCRVTHRRDVFGRVSLRKWRWITLQHTATYCNTIVRVRQKRLELFCIRWSSDSEKSLVSIPWDHSHSFFKFLYNNADTVSARTSIRLRLPVWSH